MRRIGGDQSSWINSQTTGDSGSIAAVNNVDSSHQSDSIFYLFLYAVFSEQPDPVFLQQLPVIKPQMQLSLQFLLWNERTEDLRFSYQRMYRISRLCGIFTRPQVNMVTEDSSPTLETPVDLSCPPLSYSPPLTKSATDEIQKDQTPQVPPRIRTPQTQEKAQQSTQPDTQPALPARRVPQPPPETSEQHTPQIY